MSGQRFNKRSVLEQIADTAGDERIDVGGRVCELGEQFSAAIDDGDEVLQVMGVQRRSKQPAPKLLRRNLALAGPPCAQRIDEG